MMKRDDFAPAGPDEWAAGMLTRLIDWARSPWGVRSLAAVGVLLIYLVFGRGSTPKPEAKLPPKAIDAELIDEPFIDESGKPSSEAQQPKRTPEDYFVEQVSAGNYRGIVDPSQMKPGDVCSVPGPFLIAQIQDEESAIVTIGKTPLYLTEIDTKDYADGMEFPNPTPVVVMGTRSYLAVNGGKKTILWIHPVDQVQIIKTKGGMEAMRKCLEKVESQVREAQR
jgi:hypothetical protein